MVKNRDHFKANYDSDNTPTWQSTNFHLSASLSIYQYGVHYSGIKRFKELLLELKHIAEYPKKFKSTLKNYFLIHCVYNLDNFFY